MAKPVTILARINCGALVLGVALTAASPGSATKAAVPGMCGVIGVAKIDVVNGHAKPKGTVRLVGASSPAARTIGVMGPTGRPRDAQGRA